MPHEYTLEEIIAWAEHWKEYLKQFRWKDESDWINQTPALLDPEQNADLRMAIFGKEEYFRDIMQGKHLSITGLAASKPAEFDALWSMMEGKIRPIFGQLRLDEVEANLQEQPEDEADLQEQPKDEMDLQEQLKYMSTEEFKDMTESWKAFFDQVKWADKKDWYNGMPALDSDEYDNAPEINADLRMAVTGYEEYFRSVLEGNRMKLLRLSGANPAEFTKFRMVLGRAARILGKEREIESNIEYAMDKLCCLDPENPGYDYIWGYVADDLRQPGFNRDDLKVYRDCCTDNYVGKVVKQGKDVELIRDRFYQEVDPDELRKLRQEFTDEEIKQELEYQARKIIRENAYDKPVLEKLESVYNHASDLYYFKNTLSDPLTDQATWAEGMEKSVQELPEEKRRQYDLLFAPEPPEDDRTRKLRDRLEETVSQCPTVISYKSAHERWRSGQSEFDEPQFLKAYREQKTEEILAAGKILIEDDPALHRNSDEYNQLKQSVLAMTEIRDHADFERKKNEVVQKATAYLIDKYKDRSTDLGKRRFVEAMDVLGAASPEALKSVQMQIDAQRKENNITKMNFRELEKEVYAHKDYKTARSKVVSQEARRIENHRVIPRF